MKKILLLLLVGLSAAGAALAGPPPANVNFTSERGVPFNVVLDGRIITRGLSRQVHFDRLVPGMHYVDFSVPTAYGGAVRMRSRVWLEPGLETTFVLLTRPGRPLGLRQVAAVALYSGYRGGRSYGSGPYNNGVYNNGSAYPTAPYPQQPANQPGQYNTDQYGSDQRPAEQDGAYEPAGGYDANRNSGAPNATGNDSYPRAADSYRLMDGPDVDDLLQALNQTSYEDERLQVAKQALSQSSIRAEDLQRVLKGFHLDDSRVEFAKFAYPHVIDRQNFSRIYQSFDYSANARKVQEAVGRM
jgi:hypothetical protein